ncbi:unnamed protein product [Pylaiella littoralis]
MAPYTFALERHGAYVEEKRSMVLYDSIGSYNIFGMASSIPMTQKKTS